MSKEPMFLMSAWVLLHNALTVAALVGLAAGLFWIREVWGNSALWVLLPGTILAHCIYRWRKGKWFGDEPTVINDDPIKAPHTPPPVLSAEDFARLQEETRR